MQVHSISHINLFKLYEACMLKQNNKKFLDGKFGRNLFALYNNVEITYILEDVSLYEAFLLKRFASRTTRLSNLQFLK